ncbi:hypothetical protein JZU46_00130 [bacterium]|nr:hypothetical protein [bacterium]
MVLINRHIKKQYKKTLNLLIKDLGRSVEVIKKPVKYECFNCYFDKLTNTSTNECRWALQETLQKQQEHVDSGGVGLRYKYFSKSRCPICKGKGFLETVRRQWVDCKVTWNPDGSEELNAGISGTAGKVLVELKANPKYYKLFSNCITIKVDDIICKLFKPPILRGLGNESILIVIAFTDALPEEDDSETLKEYT